MEYAEIFLFAQTWGLLYLVAMFGVVLAYALWPSNRERFDHAARIPMEEDEK